MSQLYICYITTHSYYYMQLAMSECMHPCKLCWHDLVIQQLYSQYFTIAIIVILYSAISYKAQYIIRIGEQLTVQECTEGLLVTCISSPFYSSIASVLPSLERDMCWLELHVHGNIEQLNANFFGIKMQLHHDQVLKEILVIAIAIIVIYSFIFLYSYHN